VGQPEGEEVVSSEAAKLLDDAAHALRAGTITANEFLKRTGPRWRSTARHLHTRWRRKLPAWVERDDVEQELKILAVEFVRTWDADRSTRASLGSYVMWCAVHRTQRKMDHWRGASLTGNSGKNPGRHELAFSRVYDPADGDPGTRVPAPEDDPIDRLESGEQFEIILARCQTVRQALVLLALRATDGAVDKAADALWRNFRARLECDLRSEQHAAEVVRRVIEECESLGEAPADVRPPADLFDEVGAA
jgi:hypothetical protein